MPGPSDPGGARRPGRPRSEASRRAVLDAATAMLAEAGMTAFTVDEVARRSGVSKATIYKHWSGALAIAADAWGARVTDALPVASTGDAPRDLIRQVAELAEFYASPAGHVIAQLLGRSVDAPEGAALLRERFFAPRRSATLAVIDAGIEAGQLHGDLDPELIVDLLFGPIVFRRLNGMPPLSPHEAKALAGAALRGLGVK